MKIFVTVKPRSHIESIEQTEPGNYIVRVRAVPADNEANDAVIKLIADHFNVAKSSVLISSGHTSRHKTIEIR